MLARWLQLRPLRAAARPCRALSALAAAEAHAAAPTNVTLPAPPPGQPLPPHAWKRRPGNEKTLLYERTPKEMLKNLQYLAGSPHGAPRPEPLHRLLARVTDADSFALAVKGLHSLKNAKTTFTPRTATMLAQAGVRAGQGKAVLEIFAKHKTSGLKPFPSSFVPLLRAAADTKDEELLRGVCTTLWAADIQGAPVGHTRLAGLLLCAHMACGRLDEGLRLFVRVRKAAPGDSGWHKDYRPAAVLLTALLKHCTPAPTGAGASAPPLHPAVVALVRATVLADVLGPHPKPYARVAGGTVPRPLLVSLAQQVDQALPSTGTAQGAAQEAAVAAGAEAPPAASTEAG